MAFLVATTSLPAVYCPNGYARTMTAGTPHARAKKVVGTGYDLYSLINKFSLFGGVDPRAINSSTYIKFRTPLHNEDHHGPSLLLE